jgi:hypothetical protein
MTPNIFNTNCIAFHDRQLMAIEKPYFTRFLDCARNLYITIMITSNNMNSRLVYILDILKAASMQISIWRWEMHMIGKYGFDHRYKDSWERL